jgi:hypothetical protein
MSKRKPARTSAGSWYWEVTRRGTIVVRGLAPTRVRARAEAIIAAASYGVSSRDQVILRI